MNVHLYFILLNYLITLIVDFFYQIQSLNGVVAGLIFFGIRLYMQEINLESSKAQSTALVLLNARNIRGYKSIKEMVDKTNNDAAWGNRFAFLHVPIPDLNDTRSANPLQFIWEAHKEIARKKNSWATPLTGMLLNMVNKLRGPEVGSYLTRLYLFILN